MSLFHLTAFLVNEAGGTTINEVRYRDIVTNFLWPISGDMIVEDFWFQQYAVICQTAQDAIDLFETKFDGLVISRRVN